MLNSFDLKVFVSIFPLILISFLCIIFSIYLKVKDIKFKKKGIPVKLRVKKVDKMYLKTRNVNDKQIRNGYEVTFEFEYNGTKKDLVLNSSKRFKVGSVKNGIYLDGDDKNNLSVAGEGFWLAEGGELLLASFGLFMLSICIFASFNASMQIYIYAFLIYIMITFIIIYFPYNKSGKRIEENKIEQIYHEDAYTDDYSNVDSTLVRYIPNEKIDKSVKNYKKSFGVLFFQLMFIGMGLIFIILGIYLGYHEFDVTHNWKITTAKINDTYIYSVKGEDGIINKVGIIYEYEVDGKSYLFDYKTTKSEAAIESYNVGDEILIHYDIDNPKDAVVNINSGSFIILFGIGFLFLFLGIYFIINDRNKKNFYNEYLLERDK